jgi:hypothetical protein
VLQARAYRKTAPHIVRSAVCVQAQPAGANDEARTRYLHLGKVALYRMSYVRVTLLRNIITKNAVFVKIVFRGPATQKKEVKNQ